MTDLKTCIVHCTENECKHECIEKYNETAEPPSTLNRYFKQYSWILLPTSLIILYYLMRYDCRTCKN